MDPEKNSQRGGVAQAYDTLPQTSWKDMPLLEPVEQKIPTIVRLTPALRRFLIVAIIAVLSLSTFLYRSAFFAKPSFTQGGTIVAPECAKIKSSHLVELQKSKTLSAYVFSNGQLIDRALSNGESICVVAAVPQVPAAVYYDVPIPGKGPDNLHLLMSSSSVVLTFPPMSPVPNQRGLKKLFYDGTILYYAEKEMKDTGVFNIEIEQEWSNWHWARQFRKHADGFAVEDPGYFEFPTGIKWPYTDQFQAYVIEKTNVTTQRTVPIDTASIMPNPLTVQGAARDLSRRPLCSNSVTAAKGRWYKDDMVDGTISELVDEWGYTWEGDDCKTDFYTDRDMMECLEGSNIHIYGDSNVRRIAKTILSGGHWCTNITAKCQNEDSEEWRITKLVANDTNGGGLQEEIQRLDHHWSFTNEPPWHFNFGHRSQLHFMFLRSIVEFPEDWDFEFFNEVKVNETHRDYAKLIDTAHQPVNMTKPEPDVVMLSITAWSAAFDPYFSDIEETVPWFRQTILKAFPNPNTQIVLRLGNGLCCRENPGFLETRYTGTRIQRVNEIMREGFGIPADGVRSTIDPRIIAIDPINLSGRPGVVKEFGEVFNVHPRVSHVNIETQMIMNAICEREPMTGKARLRGRRTKVVEGAII